MKKSILFLSIFVFFSNIYADSAKKWNFMVYVAANNNLYRFSHKNIKEMQQIGSNKHVNIFYQVDNFGKKESTRYKIEKGRSVKLKELKNPPESVSGTTASLFDFVKSVITENPADYNAIVLWGHASGIKDPHLWGRSFMQLQNACFYLDPKTGLYEVNKDTSRGILFNEIARTYLTNQQLKSVLERIKNELLGGRKIDLLGMDACSMAMTEVCTQIKSTAKYLAASQEVIPGYGWDYRKVLEQFLTKSPLPVELANKIVDEYGARYNSRFAGLTKSSIDLEAYDYLEKNIDEVSKILLKLIRDPQHKAFTQLLKKIRKNKKKTISFLDTDYIDLCHFYKSILTELNTYPEGPQISSLKTSITKGIELLKTCVIRNSTGVKVSDAGGLSIYFPQKTIHTSYLKTDFAKNTDWCLFLYSYLKNIRKSFLSKEEAIKIIPQEELVYELFSGDF